MKKWMFILFSLMLVITLAACGGDEAGSENSSVESDFPTKPIKIIVPFAPGGGTDVTARIVAEAASKYLPNGQNVVVENKPGGNGTIGTVDIVNADPDGYTIGMTTIGPMSIQPHFDQTPYEYDDVTAVMRIVSTQNVLLVKADSPWQTFDEWLEYVKENPGKFSYATPGAGIAPHIAMESVNFAAGIETKNVPFEGSAPAINALLGGHVQGAVVQSMEAKPFVDSGDVRILAITNKSDYFPDAPTFKEKGIDVDTELYTGLIAPKDLPKEIRDILHESFKKVIEDSEVVEKLDAQGIDAEYGYLGPDDFEEIIKREYESVANILDVLN